jgi:predicted lipid-binding transport protein (Tim44 family)
MVIEAFSNERKDDLKNLLSNDVYEVFGGEIDRLEKLGQHQDTTLVSILESTIANVEVSRRVARITVEFKSEQIYVLRDLKTDEIVEGNLSEIEEIEDVWIFEKDLKSTNPNWIIVAT